MIYKIDTNLTHCLQLNGENIKGRNAFGVRKPLALLGNRFKPLKGMASSWQADYGAQKGCEGAKLALSPVRASAHSP